MTRTTEVIQLSLEGEKGWSLLNSHLHAIKAFMLERWE